MMRDFYRWSVILKIGEKNNNIAFFVGLKIRNVVKTDSFDLKFNDNELPLATWVISKLLLDVRQSERLEPDTSFIMFIIP